MVLMLIVFFTFAVAFVVHGYFIVKNRVPTVWLPRAALSQVVTALQIKPGAVVYDLGCGDGRVLAALYNKQPAAHYVGVENHPLVWLQTRLRLPAPIRLVKKNLLSQDLSDATHVFVYLGPGLMQQLEPKFERELPAGVVVVSVQFPLQRKPVRTVRLAGGAAHAAKLFVYQF